jgi:hypothetical protein
MTSLTSDGVGWLSLICIIVGAKIVTYYSRRRAIKKRRAERSIKLQSARGKSERDLTFDEAVALQMDLHEKIAIRGEDIPERRSAMWARLLLDYELGRYADKPMIRNLDATERDLLIANTRIDAAEALANSRELLEQVRQLVKNSEEFSFVVFWGGLAFAVYQFLKTGFAP